MTEKIEGTVTIAATVRFAICDGSLKMSVRVGPTGARVATLDMSDRTSWEALHGMEFDGHVLAWAEGAYRPGHPGSFNCVPGSASECPPEGDEMEDIEVYIGAVRVTDRLPQDVIESAADALMDRAAGAGGEP